MSAATQRWIAHPATAVSGDVTVPGDKSISHRSLMLGGIAEGITEAKGFLASEDCLATLRALEALGVKIERPSPTHVVVHGRGAGALHGANHALDMGNAGTAMRLSMGLLAGQPFDSTLIGDSSLMRRRRSIQPSSATAPSCAVRWNASRVRCARWAQTSQRARASRRSSFTVVVRSTRSITR